MVETLIVQAAAVIFIPRYSNCTVLTIANIEVYIMHLLLNNRESSYATVL